MPAGRPTEYSPTFCERIIPMGKEGMSLTQMAAELGVSKQTFYNWREANPEFMDASREALTYAQAHWEKIAYRGVIGDLNVNAQVLNKSMACRFRDDYTEKTQTELSGPDGKPIEHAMILRDLPEDELTARIEAAMKAMGNG